MPECVRAPPCAPQVQEGRVELPRGRPRGPAHDRDRCGRARCRHVGHKAGTPRSLNSPHTPGARAAQRRGVVLTSRSRPLKPLDLSRFGYIIGMDAKNMAAMQVRRAARTGQAGAADSRAHVKGAAMVHLIRGWPGWFGALRSCRSTHHSWRRLLRTTGAMSTTSPRTTGEPQPLRLRCRCPPLNAQLRAVRNAHAAHLCAHECIRAHARLQDTLELDDELLHQVLCPCCPGPLLRPRPQCKRSI